MAADKKTVELVEAAAADIQSGTLDPARLPASLQDAKPESAKLHDKNGDRLDALEARVEGLADEQSRLAHALTSSINALQQVMEVMIAQTSHAPNITMTYPNAIADDAEARTAVEAAVRATTKAAIRKGR